MAKKCELCEQYKQQVIWMRKMIDRLHMQLGINPVDADDLNISDKIDALVSEETKESINLDTETFGE